MAEKKKVDIAITGANVITMEDNNLIDDGGIAVSGDSIVFVGTKTELISRFSPINEIDASGCVVMPGLVNGHTHAAMSLFRGIADDLPLLRK